MKKTALAALGVAGACAACCAIPVGLTLLAGASVSGLVGLVARVLCDQPLLAAGAAAMSFAAVIGGMWWWKRRREPAMCSVASNGCSCSPNAAPDGGCR